MLRAPWALLPAFVLAVACGSPEPLPSLQDDLNCWAEGDDLDRVVDTGTAYVVDPESGDRYEQGGRAHLEEGFQGARHINVSAEVVGDLAVTSEAEVAPRTRFLLRDESGELVASTTCSYREPYEPEGDEGFVLELPTRVVVSTAYHDQLIGHSATLTVKILDVYGRSASGQVELDIYAEDE